MLILTRKINEAIRLGDDIRIVLVQVKGGQVRIGIECPPHVRVLREELYEVVKKENLSALSVDVDQLQKLAFRRNRPTRDGASSDRSLENIRPHGTSERRDDTRHSH